jgi:subtilisin family serine protease
VGAVTDQSFKAPYSEECASLLVVAGSNGGNASITTSDIQGTNGYSTTDCTSDFGGTSAATPIVSGVISLMLSANPNLGWKDVQYILMTTAIKVDAGDSDWTTNGAGREVSHKYGYGLVDANAAVLASQLYTNYLNVSINRIYSPVVRDGGSIPETGPISSSLTLSGFSTVTAQQIQVVFSSNHPFGTGIVVVFY